MPTVGSAILFGPPPSHFPFDCLCLAQRACAALRAFSFRCSSEFVGRRSGPLAAQLYRSGILLLGHGLSITAVSAGRTQWPDSAIG